MCVGSASVHVGDEGRVYVSVSVKCVSYKGVNV